MCDVNGMLHRSIHCTLLYDYDICLRMLLKCIASQNFSIKSKKSAAMMPTSNDLQMRIVTDEV